MASRFPSFTMRVFTGRRPGGSSSITDKSRSVSYTHLSWFFDVHILLILLACALIGLAQWRADTKKGAAA